MQALTPTSIRPPNGPELYPAKVAGELRWFTAEEIGYAQHQANHGADAFAYAFSTNRRGRAQPKEDYYSRATRWASPLFHPGPFGF